MNVGNLVQPFKRRLLRHYLPSGYRRDTESWSLKERKRAARFGRLLRRQLPSRPARLSLARARRAARAPSRCSSTATSSERRAPAPAPSIPGPARGGRAASCNKRTTTGELHARSPAQCRFSTHVFASCMSQLFQVETRSRPQSADARGSGWP